MKTKRTLKQILAGILCLSLVLSFFSLWPLASAATVSGLSTAQERSALHFFIRHWHAADPSENGSPFQSDMINQDLVANRYYVIAEGYIVPNAEDVGGYTFYFVDQQSQTAIEVTDPGEAEEASAYIKSIDPQNGVIKLLTNPVTSEDGIAQEQFSGFAISAGANAVDTASGDDEADADGSITIRYRSDVHLVKGHVFYVGKGDMVLGSDDEKVFGTAEETKDREHDTAFVYAYKASGELVVGKDEHLVKVGDEENLPDDVEKDAIREVKVYSTLKGLHTDKTASVHDGDPDDRTFDLDLEAWYDEGDSPVVGMVLDASGSMAFVSDPLEPINVSDLAKNNAEIAALIQNKGLANKTPTGDWSNVFLTAAETELLLNPRNTDNSRLRSSGYSYFVYNPRPSVSEYAPLGYWDGSTSTYGVDSGVPHSDEVIGYYEFEENKELTNSVPGKKDAYLVSKQDPSNFSFNGSANGESNIVDGKLVIGQSNNNVGVRFEEQPSGSFSISFQVTKSSDAPYDQDSGTQNIIDLLYFGRADGSDTYFRAVRAGRDSYTNEGNAKSRLKGFSSSGTYQASPLNVNTVFSGDTHFVTLVYDNDNGRITAYIDGGQGASGNNTYTADVKLSGTSIVINGFTDNYNGADIYIDNVLVFNCTLDGTDVGKLYNDYQASGKDIISNSAKPPYINIKESGLEPVKQYAATAKDAVTGEDDVIGIIDQNFLDMSERAGWYYVNPSSDWTGNYLNPATQTAKTLWGVMPLPNGNETHYPVILTDTITTDSLVPDGAHKGTGAQYTPTKDTTTRFYIDEDGYLRCFFSSGTYAGDGNSDPLFHTSYVYESADETYIKSEALQRALGFFVTQLDEVFPDSQVAATRFSTPAATTDADLDKLVLLDWTSNPGDAQSILSGERKNGGTIEGDKSKNGVDQYNYGVTGSTSTVTGLKSFYDNLATATHAPKDNVKKYLILFTDGRDTDLNITAENTNEADLRQAIEASEAYRYANLLKAEGYTIFTVMLTGGPVIPGQPDYDQAKQFLLALSGGKDTPDDEKAEYFFSTDELGDEEEPEDAEDDPEAESVTVDTPSTVDALTRIFTEKILNAINDMTLEDYNVQDYIDPRFDLVDADGSVWHLNANGRVEVDDGNGTIHTVSETSTPIIKLVDREKDPAAADKGAETATLHYDSDAKMYYLVWTRQDIPGGIEGAKRLSVWNTRVTVKAKNDFIGGNAVLSNGNGTKQNYVYFPGITNTRNPADSIAPDGDASSGTNDMYREAGDDYPSKGFPRTTVNVGPYYFDVEDSQLLYMGEDLTKKDVAEKLIQSMEEAAEKDEKDYLVRYYWEYLERYQNANKNEYPTLEALIEKILSEEDGLELPYFYLDNTGNTNQTGTDDHKKDQIGTLVYKWVEVVEKQAGDKPENQEAYERYPSPEAETKDRLARKSALTVTYIPLKINEEKADDADDPNPEAPAPAKSREDLTNELIANGEGDVYQWDQDYKPAVGGVRDEDGNYRKDENGNYVEFGKNDLLDGEYLTEIVSGEIALQAVLHPDEIEALKQAGVSKLTYTADLVRNYNDKETKVGTFTVEITVDGADTLTLATIRYDETYMEENGLPIGTYTVTNGKTDDGKNGTSGFKFGESKLIDITGEDKDAKKDAVDTSDLYALGSDYENATEYPASYDGSDITLGWTDEKPDYRFGLVRVYLDPLPGSLTVKKTVTGNAGDKKKEFHFTVTLGDNTISGTFGSGKTAMEFKEGVAEFTLTDGESKTATGLPAGITYEVTEAEANQDDYVTKVNDVETNGTKGSILTEAAAVAAFENHKEIIETPEPETGDLVVTKTVTGAGDKKKEFHFTVTLSDDSISGIFGDKDDPSAMEFKEGVAEFTLMDGESKTAAGLPAGVTYKVTEAEANKDGYTTNVKDDSNGTIQKDKTAAVAVENHKEEESSSEPEPGPTPGTGDLTVIKTVTGSAGDTEKTFHLTVTLSNTTVNGTYGQMQFKDGVAELELKHGQSKTATGLPAGTEYKVRESEADQDDYATSVTFSNSTMQILEDKTVEVEFVNDKPGPSTETPPDKPSEPEESEIPTESDNSSDTGDESQEPSEEPSDVSEPAESKEESAEEPANGDPPTGDNNLLTLWLTLAVLSLGGAATVVGILTKKRIK